MAKIPDALPLAEVSGAPPSTATVQPTDFGLESAGQTMNAVAVQDRRVKALEIRAQAQQDSAAVQPLSTQFRNQAVEGFKQDAAAYDGSKPGFAVDQAAKLQQAGAKFVADQQGLTPGQRSELQRQVAGHVNDLTLAAGSYEGDKLAEPIAAQQAFQQQSQQSASITAAQAVAEPAVQSLYLSHTATDTDLPTKVGAAWDAAIQQTVGNASPQVQGAVGEQLLHMKTAAIAQAWTYQNSHFADHLTQAATAQVSTAANTIVTAPGAYDNAKNVVLPQILAGTPPALREQVERSANAAFAEARIRGLLDHQQYGQAQTELSDGRYDGYFSADEKEQLAARVAAENRAHGPEALSQAVQATTLEANMTADLYARATTGTGTGLNLDQVAQAVSAGVVSPEQYARYAAAAQAADRAFAAVGPIHDMKTPDVQALAAAPPPQPSDPDYANKLTVWQAQQQAAQAELKARQDPGQWAYSITPKPKGAAAAGAGAAQDRGAMLQQGWTDFLNATPGANRAQAGGQLAGTALGVQFAAGIPRSAWQLVPQAQAAQLAAGVINAAPDQKLTAMQSLGALIHDLPASFKMPDGSTVSPQAVLTRQLLAAHMTPVELSAIVDYGGDAAKLGRFVAALNDPTLKTPLPPGQGNNLKALVTAAVKPYLDSAAPVPGAQALAQARIDRTMLVARGLMAQQGMNPGTAAATAARDLTGDYKFVDTWRMPAALANQTSFDWGGMHSGLGLARTGAGKMLGDLIGQNGANLYAPAGLPGPPDQQRRLYAAQIQQSGRWVTAPDDSGLVLMVPHQDGTWDQVADRYGRPVRASWSQLQAYGQGNAPSPFGQPPPNAVRAPDGTPLPAFSKSAAFSALASAVTGQESRFQAGQVSSKGALGKMQVTPATVQTYAPRLGLPVDMNRALNDDDYNRRIGTAALSDNIQHYGTGAGLGLALAAYNAGRGRLEGYTDPKTGQWQPGWLQTIGDPRTGKISLSDFVARIPYKETRDYVSAVLPAALRRLQTQQ